VGSDQGRLTAGAARAGRVAYVMSRFPKVTETFVLFELLALERLGFEVEVFPLLREHERIVHPEAEALVERAHYLPLFSGRVLAAQLHYLVRRPGAYLGTLARALWSTLPSPNYFGGALLFFPKTVLIAREMERLGVRHVHAHFANHPALAALIVHRLTGIPYSFTAHGSDLHVDQTALGWKLAESAFAVTVSEYNRAFVRERVGAAAAERLRVIHCGVDPALHVRAGEVASPTFEILCVAALREVKGHKTLLEACALLAAAGVDFRCHLVGGGPLASALRAQIERAGLAERVFLHGPAARADVLARMRAAHVLVLPSIQDRAGRREGIPVTLMEAMSCGLPVVASRISGIPELVEHERSGLLFPPGDASALAATLTRVHAEPELRARLGRAGRAKIEAEFDLESNARLLAHAIQNGRNGTSG
jgi:glycosyltransferase involved in cell wall biosynthesis